MRCRHPMRRQRGFSFIELMIVIVLVIILAALALPNLLKGRKGVNQNLAKARLGEVALAQSTFRSTLRNNRYGMLAELVNTKPNGAPLVSLTFGKDGTATLQEDWVISETETATDTTYGVAITGPASSKDCRPTYCVFEDGVVRGDQCGCDRNSPPIE